ncbi:MAG: bifunctional methylenetetrahydrofolate dehydrogenase/methenyltetrahydrofolate cyclohydrolase FolD [Candidatus Spyradocola sp.]|nr:bifunctional methylenetetrahydrofolate dehydrogenase/methenyltetrahydrofolate cyclohydrolase FolD [Candidatus Spyradocola sp.]
MTAQIIDGKSIALAVRQGLEPRVEALKAKGVTPGLTVVVVGDDPASAIYVRNKERASQKLGMNGTVLRMPGETTQEELLTVVRKLNADDSIHGILVQLPLPKHIDEHAILREIDPDKDVDGFHAMNAGRLLNGEKGFVACTPKGVMRLLETTGVDLNGKNAVVVGRSNIVGKPMALLLLQKNCTVTIAHSRTRNLADVTRAADILVVAVGRAGMITGDMIKPGAVVMDVGINRVDGKVVGDVDFESAKEVASYITPVPGGVGAMTIAMLMENTVEAAENHANK